MKLLGKNQFPDNLKLANKTILPMILKTFERKLQKQLVHYIDKYLSPYLRGFKKAQCIQPA